MAHLTAYVLFVITGIILCWILFEFGRWVERRTLTQDWADAQQAWTDVNEFHNEVLEARDELFNIHEQLKLIPVPDINAGYPGTTVPCLIHGEHPADEPCIPPDDTDWKASSGILAAIQTQDLINQFRADIESWESRTAHLNGHKINAPGSN